MKQEKDCHACFDAKVESMKSLSWRLKLKS